jgi:hypothetical protein
LIRNNTGLSNRSKEYHAQRSIFKVLFDKEWHQTIDLKATTKLSSATLAKHLKQMTKTGIIERKEDAESRKYPIPVFYKASKELIEYLLSCEIRDEFSKSIDQMVSETKDPIYILEMIDLHNQFWFMQILKERQERKNMKAYEIAWLEKIFLFESYEIMISRLIEATDKIIDQIDFDQLLLVQAARMKESSETLIKKFAEALAKRGEKEAKEIGVDQQRLKEKLYQEISKTTTIEDYKKS